MKKQYKQLLTFFPIGLYYLYQVFFLGHYGFSFNDPGYLFGLGYRILQGQEMYVDFLYARPPLSPYLAAFWMYVLPEDGAFYYLNVVSYTYKLITSILLYLILKRHMPEFFKSVHHGILLLLINVFIVNYLFHLWHTTDGILFLSIAFFIGLAKTNPSNIKIYMMSFFTVLAMLTKQSFYPMPIVTTIMLYFIYSKQVSYKFAIAMFFNLTLVFLVAWLFNSEALSAYIDFKQSESQIKPLLVSGVYLYFEGFWKLSVILLFFIVVIRYKEIFESYKSKEYLRLYLILVQSYAVVFLVYFAASALLNLSLILSPSLGSIRFNFLLSGSFVAAFLWYSIELFRKNIESKYVKQFNVIFLLMIVAWCSSLSWGYKTPLLYSPIIFFFFMYLYWYITKKQISKWIILFLAISFALVSTVNILQGLRGIPHNLGEFSKVFSKTNLWNDELYENMKKIEEKVNLCKNKTFTILPSHAHIHWSHQAIPQTSLDWISVAEMLNKKQRVIDELKKVECIIIDEGYSLQEKKLFFIDYKEMLQGIEKSKILRTSDE